MEIQSVIKNLQYKVLVRCMTYNQSRYIGDALNGFAIQQTSFQFVCLVMDDASTDGEQDVIRDYLDKSCDLDKFQQYDTEEAKIVIAKHRINDNCTFAFYFLKKNLFGTPQKLKLNDEWRKCCKYEALCEGDDYWTDPLKLQKQVDFLESNPEYSMCSSDAEVLTPDGALNWTRYNENQRVSPEDMIRGGGLYVQTASLLFRRDLLKDYPSYCKNCHVGDYPLKIWGAINGGLYWFADKMVVYRYMAEGSWSRRMESADCVSLIPQWRSEVEMLKGIDEYSEHKYKTAVDFRIEEYIFGKMLHYPDKWKKISNSFRDCVALFNRHKKGVDFIMTHHLSWLYRMWCIIKKRPFPA